MSNFQRYDTKDLEEHSVTLALRDFFSSMSRSGVTEDPLALVCKSLVRCIDAVQFAFYCYAGEETGHIAAVRDGVELFLPPPDVERKIVAQLRRKTSDDGVAIIPPEASLALLSDKERKEWKCHVGLSIRVRDGDDRDAAVLAVYLPHDFKATPRHRGWMALFADAASVYLTQFRAFSKSQGALAEAIEDRDEQSMTLNATRQRVREHLSDLMRIMAEQRAGDLTVQEALCRAERSAESLYSLSDVIDRSEPVDKPRFFDREFGGWVKAGIKDSRIKAIVGVRGSNKSAFLHAIHKSLLTRGVPESHLVIINFEDARFRRFKTASDVIAYLDSFPESKRTRYLFLDEIGMVNWHTDLLGKLQRMPGWNVWLAASTAHAVRFADRDEPVDILTYRAWTDPHRPRSRSDLEKIWCQIFMRDVVSGVDHPDIRAKETLAEYYSDHLGEIKSLQKISREITTFGRRLSCSSISAYRQSLIDAYLIEMSEVYDVFEKSVVTSVSGRAFYTDLELRNWRYGCAPDKDSQRLALNRLYLELRRTYDHVYTPRDADADFVTIEANGELRLWKVPEDTLATPDEFRGRVSKGCEQKLRGGMYARRCRFKV